MALYGSYAILHFCQKRSNAKIQMATIFKIIFTLSVYWSWFWIRPVVILHSERHWQCVWHPSEVSVVICCVICDVIRRDLRLPSDTVIGKRVTLWATMIDIRDHTHKGLTYIILSKTLNFLSEWSVFWTDLFHKCPCSAKFPLEEKCETQFGSARWDFC